jgi:hypothetical protein
MLRVNLASILSGVVLVVIAALCRYWYVVQRMGGYRRDVAVGVNAISPHHPFLYTIPIFLIGLYIGGRIFK